MGVAPRMPGGRNLPKVLQVPFCVFESWITGSAQIGGKTRLYLFCAYNTATISISLISPSGEGRIFYALYDTEGKLIGSTTEILRTGNINLNVSTASYIEFTGRAESQIAYAVGTLTATR